MVTPLHVFNLRRMPVVGRCEAVVSAGHVVAALAEIQDPPWRICVCALVATRPTATVDVDDTSGWRHARLSGRCLVQVELLQRIGAEANVAFGTGARPAIVRVVAFRTVGRTKRFISADEGQWERDGQADQ